MASKEALDELKRINSRQNNNNGDIWLEMIIQPIEKDLEVLEILKRIDWLIYNNVDKNDFNWYIDTNKSMKLTKEEVEKIKDWLKGK